MPSVHVYGFDRPVDVKRRVVQGITEVLCREYQVGPEHVIVNIVVMARDHVAHRGMLVADRDAAAVRPADPPRQPE